MIVNKSIFAASQGFSAITRMQQRMDKLQVQLGTGERSQTLAEMGNNRIHDLTIRSRLARIEGYTNNATTATLRLDVLDTVMSRLDKIEAETRTSASVGGYGSDGINLVNVPALSKARLDEVVTLLNSDIAGRYLFGGSTTDKKPVASMTAILDGEGGLDGFRTIAGERKLADAGTDGLGRLDLTRAGAIVTLAEDGTHPFGFKLSTLSTDSGAITVTAPTGSPASLSVEFTGAPTAGQTVTVGLTLPDGTETTVTLEAVTGTPAAGQFQIGVTPTDTATNFEAALSAGLLATGTTKLAVASSFAAADNFFNGQGETVMRVDGPPFETATGLIAATTSDTVDWYRGEDNAAARQTVGVKVDDGTIIGYGAQANEHGFVELMKSLAVMTVETYPSGDATSKDRFNAVAATQSERLSEAQNGAAGSIEVIGLELGLAKGSINAATERHDAYKVQLDTMLADIEQVSVEEVAMELLSLKTRLEASFQTMSMVSQLSLVNYL